MPIDFTDAGMVIEASFLQRENAPSPIDLIVLGRTIEVSLLQFSNAGESIAVRLVPVKLDSFRFQGKEAQLEYFWVSFEDA